MHLGHRQGSGIRQRRGTQRRGCPQSTSGKHTAADLLPSSSWRWRRTGTLRRIVSGRLYCRKVGSQGSRGCPRSQHCTRICWDVHRRSGCWGRNQGNTWLVGSVACRRGWGRRQSLPRRHRRGAGHHTWQRGHNCFGRRRRHTGLIGTPGQPECTGSWIHRSRCGTARPDGGYPPCPPGMHKWDLQWRRCTGRCVRRRCPCTGTHTARPSSQSSRSCSDTRRHGPQGRSWR